MPHGKLSPSKAHRWLVCPGSQFHDTEGPESQYAEDGQLGHAILESVLHGTPVLTGDLVLVGDNKGVPAPAHRIQQAIEIRDWVNQWRTQHPDFVVESESHVSVSRVLGYSSRPDDFDGTADIVAYSVTKRELVIVDAKFGFVRVEPKDNPQLYLYAMGALNELWDIFLPEDTWQVTVIIAQPDYEGVVQFREHRMTFEDLWEWYKSARASISAAADGDQTLNPASEHACRYCPARASCAPRQEVLMQFAQDEWRMTKTLGELLPLLPQIRRIADDLEAEAVKQLAADMTVPGYKLVESRSIRQWSPNHDVVLAAENAGLDIMTKKFMSPAQVEKKYGTSGKIFTKAMAITPRGQPKLAPESDPREPYKPENFTQEEIDEMLKGE